MWHNWVFHQGRKAFANLMHFMMYQWCYVNVNAWIHQDEKFTIALLHLPSISFLKTFRTGWHSLKTNKGAKIRETFCVKIKKKCWHFVFVIIFSAFRFSGKIFVLLCLKMQPITLALVIKTSVKVQKMQERS